MDSLGVRQGHRGLQTDSPRQMDPPEAAWRLAGAQRGYSPVRSAPHQMGLRVLPTGAQTDLMPLTRSQMDSERWALQRDWPQERLGERRGSRLLGRQRGQKAHWERRQRGQKGPWGRRQRDRRERSIRPQTGPRPRQMDCS